uniref:Reverse transcriptase domain-containing protein n=1 Tax=Gasterosteus aculeatus aculeatus TaxID=481459 RepID=A0AAQ4PPT0_GASAC
GKPVKSAELILANTAGPLVINADHIQYAVRALQIPPCHKLGVRSTSEVFQVQQLFSGYLCAIIVDDIIIGGCDAAEHDTNLKNVLDRAREVNLKLNPLKCKFCLDHVCYVGHIFTGLTADPAKKVAIANMPVPQDVPAMQRFLGMVNYLGKFIPNLSDIAAPLRQLTHKDAAWCWFPQHQQAFDRLKSCLSSSTILSYYDVRYQSHRPVMLRTRCCMSAGWETSCLRVSHAHRHRNTLRSN